MAINSFLSSTPKSNIEAHQTKKKDNDQKNMSMKKKMKKKVISPPSTPRAHVREHQVISSWEQLKSILSCRAINAMASQVHDPSKKKPAVPVSNSNYTKLRSSCGPSICVFRDVVHGNARVGHRSDTDRNSGSSSPGESRRHETTPLARPSGRSCSSSRAGGMPLRRLSGCYECHAISIDSASRRYPRPRTLSACSECGEVFTKPESLELHQTIRHAVSELGPDDSGRHVVDIIFKSSWHRRALPACKIERILKVRNSQLTVARFEEYRAAVKSRALNPKKHPRCAADGNELLRFHPAVLSCALGSGSDSSLCSSSSCGVCGIIRQGFARGVCGVRTTASSGRAHELAHSADGGGSRAMMVCRVIAGRVRRAGDEEDAGAGGSGYDSVAGADANLEDLSVGNPRAILPCFVVIYRLVE